MRKNSVPLSDNSSRSIDRLIDLFRAYSPSEVELSVSEVCNKTVMSRATAYRLLSASTRVGLLEKNPENSKYGPGPALFQVGMLYLNRTDITKAAGPVIKAMNELSGENVNVVIFDKGNIVMIMKEEAKYDFRLASRVGTVLPAYPCASGRAFLSELSNEELEGLYPHEELKPITQKTISNKTDLKRELELVRKTGVSVDKEGTFEGVEGIASVVRDSTGKPVAAISMTVPIFRMDEGRRKLLSEFVGVGAALISYRLGHQNQTRSVRDIDGLRLWWEQNRSVRPQLSK